MTFPGTTWYVRIWVSWPDGSLSSVSRVPLGSAPNAASVGAKTVNGPAPLRVSTRSAAVSALASVVKSPAATAVSTMSEGAAGVGDIVSVAEVVGESADSVELPLPQAAMVRERAAAAATAMRVRRIEGSFRWVGYVRDSPAGGRPDASVRLRSRHARERSRAATLPG